MNRRIPQTCRRRVRTSLFVIVIVELVLTAIFVCTCRPGGKRRATAHLDERVDELLLVPAKFF
jgi:hypothetical protein